MHSFYDCLTEEFFVKIMLEAKIRINQKVTVAEENEKAEWWHLLTVIPNTIKLSCFFLLEVPSELYNFPVAREFGQRLCVNPVPLCAVQVIRAFHQSTL